MQLTIPTIDEIREAVRGEIAAAFSSYQIQPQTESDEIGKGAEFASKITGKAVPTIYDLVSKRLIPHSKKGKDLYFSKNELLKWLTDGKRKTQTEIAADAANFQSNQKTNSKN
jgi:predicted DNA-binding transcriptional regulator AlpA